MGALKSFTSFHYKETISGKVGLGSHAASGVKEYMGECPGRNIESLALLPSHEFKILKKLVLPDGSIL